MPVSVIVVVVAADVFLRARPRSGLLRRPAPVELLVVVDVDVVLEEDDDVDVDVLDGVVLVVVDVDVGFEPGEVP